MDNQFHFDKSKVWGAVLCLLGLMVVLAACSPAKVSTSTPTVDPGTPTPTPVPPTIFEQWTSSPHAKVSAQAFRQWDTTDPQQIPVTCAGCHSRPGMLDYLGVDGTAAGVVDNPAPTGSVITCYVCHNEATYTMDSVTFPSRVRVGGLGPEVRCLLCHQGRASTSAVNIAIAKAAVANDDTPSPDLAFVNSHYTSGATSFGSEVHGAYEYNDKTYQGRFMRGQEFFTCIRCHDQHTLKVKIETCGACHSFDGTDSKTIRVNTTDFDGDGNTTEGAYYEVETFQVKLLAAIQAYGRDVVKQPIAYDLAHFPYFFYDTNNNGVADPDEAVVKNQYKSWTPRLLRAAYNYNYSMHDKGAFAHNSTYIMQVSYDSLADIGGDTTGMTRP
jgi:uncharacterized CHY-type Zn-finger protein